MTRGSLPTSPPASNAQAWAQVKAEIASFPRYSFPGEVSACEASVRMA